MCMSCVCHVSCVCLVYMCMSCVCLVSCVCHLQNYLDLLELFALSWNYLN